VNDNDEAAKLGINLEYNIDWTIYKLKVFLEFQRRINKQWMNIYFQSIRQEVNDQSALSYTSIAGQDHTFVHIRNLESSENNLETFSPSELFNMLTD
jgi:hypothetical protein